MIFKLSVINERKRKYMYTIFKLSIKGDYQNDVNALIQMIKYWSRPSLSIAEVQKFKKLLK